METAKKLGIAEQTLIRWRKEYGGLQVDQVKRFKELEKENDVLNPGIDFDKITNLDSEIEFKTCFAPNVH